MDAPECTKTEMRWELNTAEQVIVIIFSYIQIASKFQLQVQVPIPTLQSPNGEQTLRLDLCVFEFKSLFISFFLWIRFQFISIIIVILYSTSTPLLWTSN